MKYFNIFVLFASTLFLAGCSNTPASLSPSKSTESVKSAPQSLKDLLALGVAQKCTWNSTVDGNAMTGTILIKGQKFKQTGIVSTSGETSIESNTVSDGTYLYIWTNLGQKNGLKMKLDAAQAQASADVNGAPKFNLNQKMDFHCTPATVSDADLNVPSTIIFTDFSETIKNLQKLKH